MDNVKVQDSRLKKGKKQTIRDFLARKAASNSVSTTDSSENRLQPQPQFVLPKYSIELAKTSIAENVEYEFQLVERYEVFDRPIERKYVFKSRYSLLAKLSQKMGTFSSFPPKKLFGSKEPNFVLRRSCQLQRFLNRVAAEGSTGFYEFVKQIKDNDFNKQMRRPFEM